MVETDPAGVVTGGAPIFRKFIGQRLKRVVEKGNYRKVRLD